jgi:hypothetical protein
MMLAKSMARVVAVLAETPVRDIANTAADDSGATAMPWKALDGNLPVAMDGPPRVPPGMPAVGQTVADQQDHDRLQGLFATLPAEEWIRKDLKTAAQHGSTAMQLGGCANNN